MWLSWENSPGMQTTPGLVRSPGEGIGNPLQYSWASLVAQMVKYLPAMQHTWVQSLSWEDPLQEGMATHSSILAWEIPWTENPGGLQSIRSQRIGHDWAAKQQQRLVWTIKKGVNSHRCLWIRRAQIHYLCPLLLIGSSMQQSFGTGLPPSEHPDQSS